jgi:hypothetical protein
MLFVDEHGCLSYNRLAYKQEVTTHEEISRKLYSLEA